jgi:hypothetical protein
MYGSISIYFSNIGISVTKQKVCEMETERTVNKKMKKGFIDPKINVKIIIAGLWISQFLIWTFGDMMSLLQKLDPPASNLLLGFVAAPLGIIQVSMVIYSLAGKAKVIRWANLLVTPIFVIFNIGFLFEARFGWEFVLGVGYIAVNALIIGYAWKWPRIESEKKEVIS